MRRMIVLLFTLALALGALPAAAQAPELAPLHRAQGEVVEGAYIVVMKPGRAAELAAEPAGVRPTHVYAHALDGFAARMSPRQLEAVRRNPNVAFVEEDQVATAAAPDAGTQGVGTLNQQNPPWGLDRIDQRYLPLDGWYRYYTTAAGVHAYVFDTGIQTGHWEFGGRARRGYDAFGGTSEDCHGHGTAVASVIGGSYYGVAKGVTLHSVRVLNCSGSGSFSGIIAGVDWVRYNHRKPAVANMSLGGGYSSALNTAVNDLSGSGVFVAVGAGSSNANACNFSPPSAHTVFTTMASDRDDRRVTSSNYGGCTHGYAPGHLIPALGFNGGTILLGASAAPAHVTGVGAMYKATYGDQHYATVRNWIINNATPNVIQGNPSGTPNRLLYKSNL